MKYAQLGTISEGTLKTEDLLSAFISELEWQISRNGDWFCQPENFSERDRLNNLVGEAQDLWTYVPDDADVIDDDKMEEADEMVEKLSNALEEFAPPYCYFGTHYGDGADFGFWASHDLIAELPHVEGSDEAKELGEDCQTVNDHGNVTVWSGDGVAVLELV